jgi:hypothetical protein
VQEVADSRQGLILLTCLEGGKGECGWITTSRPKICMMQNFAHIGVLERILEEFLYLILKQGNGNRSTEAENSIQQECRISDVREPASVTHFLSWI